MRREQTSTPSASAAMPGGIVRDAIMQGVLRARRHYQEGALDEAKRACEAVRALMPDQFDALQVLGLVALGQGDPVTAEQWIARSVRVDSKQGWAWANYAVVLNAQGRFGDALEPADRALRLDGRSLAARLARANALLGLQRYAECDPAYEGVLALDPSSAEAWANRGKALLKLGRFIDALASVDRSIAIAPRVSAPHVNRGNALSALGRHEEALRSYDRALELQPEVADIWCLRGVALQELGRDALALHSFDTALRLAPSHFEAILGSGISHEHLQHHAEALAYCDRAIGLVADDKRAWLTRGNALQGLLRYDDALEAYDRALTFDSQYADALGNRGAALHMLHRYDDALDSYERALAIAPTRADTWGVRGNLLQQIGRYDDAAASYTQATLHEPDCAPAWFHRGSALQHMNRHDEALDCFSRAIELQPTHAESLTGRAICKLLLGDFLQGWREYETRWLDPAAARRARHFNSPLWLGQHPLAGKTLLVHAEQGFGDTLQFCRYVSVIAAHGAHVVLEAPTQLMGLLATLDSVATLIPHGKPLPAFDFHCPMLSLPLAVATAGWCDAEPLPTSSYLHADPQLVSQWRERIAVRETGKRLRVGLAWSGNPDHTNDHNRSIAFAQFTEWFALDVQFVSLQQVVRPSDSDALAQSGALHFGDTLRDFSDTAALVESLDLVISVDTSIAHLAGALGRPVWMLLPFVPDWRWQLARDDTRWYPQATLFRQRAPGDWRTVIARVADALRERAAETETEK
ncbi:tetratricopeptide repeat protein [Paraburkholderia flava]|uniref:tetratricopeptide repeat protein n=1 Tax=Paraburkholderia flava TaxID=2547393 RepID=UPI00106150BB|nr:tetratricopeptide repeat protein [Paraburkholderia flava]